MANDKLGLGDFLSWVDFQISNRLAKANRTINATFFSFAFLNNYFIYWYLTKDIENNLRRSQACLLKTNKS